jgi:hypothetical protein
MSCVGLFALPVGSESYLAAALDGHMLLGDDGSKAWTRIYKNNQKQYSHTVFFLQGLGGIYFSFHNQFTMVCIPLEGLLIEGITFESYEAHIQQEKGLTRFSKHSVILNVMPGNFVNVPHGHVIRAFAYEAPPKPKKEDWKPALGAISFVPLSLPLSDLSDAALVCIKKLNASIFDTKNHRMWNDRLTYYNTVLAL